MPLQPLFIWRNDYFSDQDHLKGLLGRYRQLPIYSAASPRSGSRTRFFFNQSCFFAIGMQGELSTKALIFLPASYNQLIFRPVLFNGISPDILSIFIHYSRIFCGRPATLGKTAAINQAASESESGGDLSVKTDRDRLFSTRQ